jgi:SAM-dependent methyltransferase
MLINFMKKIKPHLPLIIVRFLSYVYYRICMKSFCMYLDFKENTYCAENAIPRASLRYRVNGIPDVSSFLSEGEKCSDDLIDVLAKTGRALDSFQHILDFGSGCGRTLRWLGRYSDRSSFYGTDIDSEAIDFCRDAMTKMHFSVNKSMPPLEYPEAHFDLIYSISVFTHINEEFQFRWLAELERVSKPGGIVLLSIHGQHCWNNLPTEYSSKINFKGFLFVEENIWKGIFPEWYQTAFHTEEYVRNNFSKYFSIIDYIPRGISDFQDLVVLQKV